MEFQTVTELATKICEALDKSHNFDPEIRVHLVLSISAIMVYREREKILGAAEVFKERIEDWIKMAQVIKTLIGIETTGF